MGNLVLNYAVCFVVVISPVEERDCRQTRLAETGHPFCFCTRQLCLTEIWPVIQQTESWEVGSPGDRVLEVGGECGSPELSVS